MFLNRKEKMERFYKHNADVEMPLNTGKKFTGHICQSKEVIGSRFSVNTFGPVSLLHFQADESGICNDCGL